jgi:catechol 2,3-dioxygenase-like lactoylglutathione lyase family enzyme
MKLGTYVEISTTVEQNDAAIAFYQQLGYQHAGYSVLTDGSINLNLAPPGVPAPMLRYAGSDIEALVAADIGVQQTDRGLGIFITPEGLHIMLSPFESRVPMPEGTPTTRTPVSRCGTFGEYALPTSDLQASRAFWEKLGFQTLHSADEGEPYAILSDDLIVIGLHQTSDFSEPHITYFAPDMAERIQALQAEGFSLKPFPATEDGTIVNAAMEGPGGERFFLFYGSI